MDVDSLRKENDQEVFAFILMTAVAAFFWTLNDLYVEPLAVGVGAIVGALVVAVYQVTDRRPVAGFPIVILSVITMVAALRVRSLVAGVVVALAIVSVSQAYQVYLS